MLSFLATLWCTLLVPIQSEQCIVSYPNHTFEYMVNNLNNPSVIYLGDKTSTTHCIHSCLDFNYLCDKSNKNVFAYTDDPSNPFVFDNTSCSAQSTHTGDMMSYGSFALLTSNIMAREYVIETQLTITSGEQAGIIFKAQQSPDWNYWVYVNPNWNTMPTGPYETNWESSWWHDTSTFRTYYNTKYNLSIHIIDNTFQRYLNGQAIGNLYVFDESLWSQSYAGLFTWRGSVIYHSLQLKFPDDNDNADRYICRAYMYDKQQGHCYGYYGNDYSMVQNSIVSDIWSDSGIIYEPATCAPTQYPTNSPTTISPTTTIQPTKSPISPTNSEPTNSPISPSIYPSVPPTTTLTTTATTTTAITTSPTTTIQPTKTPISPTTSEPTNSPISPSTTTLTTTATTITTSAPTTKTSTATITTITTSTSTAIATATTMSPITATSTASNPSIMPTFMPSEKVSYDEAVVPEVTVPENYDENKPSKGTNTLWDKLLYFVIGWILVIFICVIGCILLLRIRHKDRNKERKKAFPNSTDVITINSRSVSPRIVPVNTSNINWTGSFQSCYEIEMADMTAPVAPIGLHIDEYGNIDTIHTTPNGLDDLVMNEDPEDIDVMHAEAGDAYDEYGNVQNDEFIVEGDAEIENCTIGRNVNEGIYISTKSCSNTEDNKYCL